MRRLPTLLALLSVFIPLHAQYVTLTGTLQGPNGFPVSNAILSLQPTQLGYVAGSSPLVVIPLNAECATSTAGNVVGVPNPLSIPQVSAAFTGTLPAGNYYVEIAWYDAAAHTTLVSPEARAQLTGTGELVISPPASGMPANAAGSNIYIGATSGSETYQGAIAGSGTYYQNTALVSGAAVPASNTTVCQIIANDAMWPSGTGYQVSLTSPAGATLPGYPMQWQLLGPNTTINLGLGLPLYNGITTYPAPLLAIPYNHGPQSMSGPFSLAGYNLTLVGQIGVGTGTPGWGIDVEGTGIKGIVNAAVGYLLAGTAPAVNTCLGSSDGISDGAQIACLYTGSTAGGDLSGTYPNPTVARIQGQAVAAPTTAGPLYWTGSAFVYLPGIATTNNCVGVGTAASPSVASCASAAAGAFSCATNASGATCVVNTTAVTANSEVEVHQVGYAGTRLGVTCNTSSVLPSGPLVTSIAAGTSFTVTLGTVTTNPGCFVYTIVN